MLLNRSVFRSVITNILLLTGGSLHELRTASMFTVEATICGRKILTFLDACRSTSTGYIVPASALCKMTESSVNDLTKTDLMRIRFESDFQGTWGIGCKFHSSIFYVSKGSQPMSL